MRVNCLYLFLLAVLLCGCDSQPSIKALGTDSVIVAFGDSLTAGTGVSTENSYPSVLSRLSHRTVINEGIPGEVSASGLKRLPHIIEEHSPALIIICHGGNDILRRKSMKDAENNIRAMVKMAKDNNIDVILVAVPEFNLWASPPDFYAKIAREFNIPFAADIIGDLQKNKRMKSDSVHFNAEGYSLLAENLHNILKDSHAIDN